MNDFETDGEEVTARGTDGDADVVAAGLLARDHATPGARLRVVDPPERTPATERLYRELPVRVDGTPTALLVGPWCRLRRERTYRIRTVGERRGWERLVTVEVVSSSDRETGRYGV